MKSDNGGFDLGYNIDYRGMGKLAYGDYIKDGELRTFNATVL